jgi:DNA-binding NarL/FixJ family response regulator
VSGPAPRAAADGRTTLAPSATAVLVRRSRGAQPTLSGREIEILGELATGGSNRDVAMLLFVSEATVKSHLSHIYTKLGVDNRAAPVARAIEQRIIRPVTPA